MRYTGLLLGDSILANGRGQRAWDYTKLIYYQNPAAAGRSVLYANPGNVPVELIANYD